MPDWRPLGWTLLVMGTISIVAGVYQTGATGDVSTLLMVGMGATTVGMVLLEELQETSTDGADSEPGEST